MRSCGPFFIGLTALAASVVALPASALAKQPAGREDKGCVCEEEAEDDEDDEGDEDDEDDNESEELGDDDDDDGGDDDDD